jgi:hypothetical protein
MYPHTALRHRPIEKAGENFAVAVGGLRRQPPALYPTADESCDVSRADLLKAVCCDDSGLAAAVLTWLWRSLLRPRRCLAACDFQRFTNRAERIAEVVDVGLSTLRRLYVSDVRNVRGDNVINGRPCWKRVVVPVRLGRFKLAQFLFCDLKGFGSSGNAFRLPGNHVLNVKD